MEYFDATIKKQGGNASISGGYVPNALILSPTFPPVQNQFVLSSLISSVAAVALVNVRMNSTYLLLNNSLPTPNHVPPLASKICIVFG